MSNISRAGSAVGERNPASGNISDMLKDSPRLRVLVVDDEPLIRWSLGQTLEQAGHAVMEAGDAESAIRSVSAGEPFDVVLLDYRLPDRSEERRGGEVRTVRGARDA